MRPRMSAPFATQPTLTQSWSVCRTSLGAMTVGIVNGIWGSAIMGIWPGPLFTTTSADAPSFCAIIALSPKLHPPPRSTMAIAPARRRSTPASWQRCSGTEATTGRARSGAASPKNATACLNDAVCPLHWRSKVPVRVGFSSPEKSMRPTLSGGGLNFGTRSGHAWRGPNQAKTPFGNCGTDRDKRIPSDCESIPTGFSKSSVLIPPPGMGAKPAALL
mmetsp:Transcript_4525/g.16051  ORF Transcript_4525/g.16051 Transcript_4525/m.16051 type:complete len:218 (-) Transcript_4525:1550-2203(-)